MNAKISSNGPLATIMEPINRRAEPKVDPHTRKTVWTACCVALFFAIIAAAYHFGIINHNGNNTEINEKITKTSTEIEHKKNDDEHIGIEGSVATAAGLVKADQIATVSAEITGTIEKIFVKRGQRVTKGMPLAMLNTSILESQLKSSTVRLELASLNLKNAKENLPIFESVYRRIEALKGKGIVSVQSFENSQIDFKNKMSEIAKLELEFHIAQIEKNMREADLIRGTIKAPFDGVITSLDASVGEVVSPISAAGGFARTGIATIVDTSQFRAEIWLPERLLKNIYIGQPIAISLDYDKKSTLKGAVASIAPFIDDQKAAVLVIANILTSSHNLKHNMSLHVDFLTGDQLNVASGKNPNRDERSD